MEIKGTVHRIYDKQQVSDKFAKRDIVIKVEESVGANTYYQFLKIQFTQAKCDLLDHNRVGDIVTVNVNLKGKEYTKKDQSVDYFNTIEGWKITTDVSSATPANQAIQNEFSKPAPEMVWGGDDNTKDDLPF